jgi:hypothetical protein
MPQMCAGEFGGPTKHKTLLQLRRVRVPAKAVWSGHQQTATSVASAKLRIAKFLDNSLHSIQLRAPSRFPLLNIAPRMLITPSSQVFEERMELPRAHGAGRCNRNPRICQRSLQADLICPEPFRSQRARPVSAHQADIAMRPPAPIDLRTCSHGPGDALATPGCRLGCEVGPPDARDDDVSRVGLACVRETTIAAAIGGRPQAIARPAAARGYVPSPATQ